MILRSATFDYGKLAVCFDGQFVRIQGDDGDLICFVNPLLSGRPGDPKNATGRVFTPCTTHCLRILRWLNDKGQKKEFLRVVGLMAGDKAVEVTP